MNETLLEIEERVSDLLFQQRSTLKEIEEAKGILDDKEEEMQRIVSLVQACQVIASAIQQTAHKKISSIVTKCLGSIFDDPYEFELIFEQKRGKTECHPIFKRDGNVIEDPMSASGGGAVDVAAFALRLASVVLKKPSKRKFLVFDEPFRFVSKKYRPRIRQLLEELSEGYGVQIVIVTHMEELKIGTICSL